MSEDATCIKKSELKNPLSESGGKTQIDWHEVCGARAEAKMARVKGGERPERAGVVAATTIQWGEGRGLLATASDANIVKLWVVERHATVGRV